MPLRPQRRETDRRGAEPGAASKGALPRISRVHGVEGGELEPRQAVRPSARAHTYAGGAPVSAAAAVAGGSEIADRPVGSNTAMPYGTCPRWCRPCLVGWWKSFDERETML